MRDLATELLNRLELEFDPGQGYINRGGMEYPISPLRVIRVWAEGINGVLAMHDLSEDPIVLEYHAE